MEEPSITIKLKFGCCWFRSKPIFLRYSIDSQQWQPSYPLRWEINCDCFHWWRCVGYLNAIWKTKVQAQQQLPEAVTRDRPQIIFAEKGSHNFEQTTQMVPSFHHPPIKYQKMFRWVKEGALECRREMNGNVKGYLTIGNPLLMAWFRWVLTIG